MRAFVFILGFFLGFTLDVSVQASERVQLRPIDLKTERSKDGTAALLEEPKLCLDKEAGACALRVGDRRLFTFGDEKREWTLAEKTIVVRLSESRLRLIEGSIRLSGEETTVETEQGDLTVVGEGFIDRAGGRLTVVNTGDKPLTFRGRGWKAASEIPSGLETHIDLPGVKNGLTAVSLPLPLDYDAQVVREARFYTGKKDEFSKRLEYLVDLRSQSAVDAANLHREVVERKIATIEARESEQRQERLKREAKNKEIRALFRKNVLDASE